LVIYIPKQWVQDLKDREQFRRLEVDEFQMLVWSSYREAQAGDVPDDIQAIYQSKVIHGPINAKSPMQIRRLQNRNGSRLNRYCLQTQVALKVMNSM
jgi:hypothetical protein